jgi:peptidoglycan/LPS O-acetylase OafA/YrhL
LAVLTVVVALAFKIPPHFERAYTQPTARAVWQNLLLVENLFHSPDIIGPMWSLPLEMQMYLVLPLLYIAARRVRSYAGALALICGGFLTWYVDSHIARHLGRAPLVPYAPWFFFGVSAYGLYHFIKPSRSPGLYAVCLLLFAAMPSLTHRLMRGDYRSGWVVWGCGALFALALPNFRDIPLGVISKCTHSIATYSYGIYLSHVPIMWLTFQRLSGPLWLQVGLFLVLMATVPVLLYHGLESPLIRAGSRMADLLNRPPKPVMACVEVGT